MKKALILFSHGSLLCGSGEAVDQHAERLRRCGDWDLVRVGYLNYTDPPFAQSVAEVVAEGATEIVILPYFLVSGYFVTKSLPEVLNPVKAAHPDVRFIVAEALGYDAVLADALLAAADTAQGPEHWREGLTRAAQHCLPNPQCPLYGTPACPKMPEGLSKEPVHV